MKFHQINNNPLETRDRQWEQKYASNKYILTDPIRRSTTSEYLLQTFPTLLPFPILQTFASLPGFPDIADFIDPASFSKRRDLAEIADTADVVYFADTIRSYILMDKC